MENLNFVYDPFCEKEFWKSVETNPANLTNPLCALTGVCMTIMALCTRNIVENTSHPSSTALFILCKASLALVGVGTVIFHLVDDQSNMKALNFRMADRLSMVLMCTNIFMLFFFKLFSQLSEFLSTALLFIIYAYMCTQVLLVDSAPYELFTLKLQGDGGGRQNVYETYVNAPMLAPLAVILLCALYRGTRLICATWLLIIFNLGLWLPNAYLCRETPILFVLHAVFHVTIAYTFLFAACVGMTLDGEWIFDLHYCWGIIPWPMIAHNPTRVTSKFITHPCSVKIRI
jgi:hypothetical protein